VHPVLYLTRPRANRKPVLQFVDDSGDAVVYVKIGTDPLTQELVAREAAALRLLDRASLRIVRAPTVVHHGQWRSLELLALSPLPVWRGRRIVEDDRLASAMREVAAVEGLVRRNLRGSPYREKLTERLAALDAPYHASLRVALQNVEQAMTNREMIFGAWHGDWATWNLAFADGRLLVWDWERFDTQVPFGFDAVHYDLHRRLLDPASDTRALVLGSSASAAPLLRRMGVSEDDRAAVTVLYLIEIAARYRRDRQDQAGNLAHILDRLVEATVLASHALTGQPRRA
jgi:hypothetical protein